MMMSGLDGLLTDLDQSLQLSLKHRSAIVPLPSLAGHELDLDTKLLHGAKPDEIKDLFAPRTGVLELPAELQGSQYARVRLPTPSAVPESRQRRRVATAQHQPELHTGARVLTWDSPKQEARYRSPLLSEAPEAAVEHLWSQASSSSCIAAQDVLGELCALALGTPTALFAWHARRQRFIWRHKELRISGLSQEVSTGLMRPFLDLATAVARLELLTNDLEEASASSTHTSAAAAVSAISTFVAWVRQAQAGVEGQSLLSRGRALSPLIEACDSVLSVFRRDLATERMARIADPSARALLSMVHDTLEERIRLDASLALLPQIAVAWLWHRMVSQWWREWQEWVGVREDTGAWRHGAIEQTRAGSEPDFVLHTSRVPSFMPVEVVIRLFEAGRALRVLGAVRSLRAVEIQQRMRQMPHEAPYAPGLRADVSNISTVPACDDFDDLFARFDAPPQSTIEATASEAAGISQFAAFSQSLAASGLSTILPTHLPSLTALVHEQLFAPLLACAREPANALARVLFNEMALEDHVGVLLAYHLQMNAGFVRRIQLAIFSRAHERVGASLARRRQRDENAANDAPLGILLRGGAAMYLALSNTILETVAEQPSLHGVENRLSFAVQTDVEPRGPETATDARALDHIALEYRAPYPLNLVLTRQIVTRYATIFSFLLRVMRAHAVTRNTWLDLSSRGVAASHGLQLVAFETNALISGLASYANDVCARQGAGVVQQLLARVQQSLGSDGNGNGVQWDVRALERAHLRELDTVAEQLALRTRQAPLASALDQLMEVALKVGNSVDATSSAPTEVLREDLDQCARTVARVLDALATRKDWALALLERLDPAAYWRSLSRR